MKKKILKPLSLIGITRNSRKSQVIEDAIWYQANKNGDLLHYDFEKGTLTDFDYLYFDLYFDGLYMAKHTFSLRFIEEDSDNITYFTYAVLPKIEARFRLPLAATNQDAIWLPREGGLIKPASRGERVHLRNVTALEIKIDRIGYPIAPITWCQTDIMLTTKDPGMLTNPKLPEGLLVDKMGQSILQPCEWHIKSEEELDQHLRRQYKEIEIDESPNRYSRWGGDLSRKTQGSGYFRTYFEDHKWWLVDPDGYLFWSSGIDCTTLPPPAEIENIDKAYEWLPERDGEFADAWRPAKYTEKISIDFLTANFIRVFGAKEWKKYWNKITISQVKKMGFNTFGNWSEWQLAEENDLPYVRQLDFKFNETPMAYRDFPDVYHPSFIKEVKEAAQELEKTKKSQAMIGYFLQNEAQWSFTEERPAEGMLYTTEACYCRTELKNWLKEKYVRESDFKSAWKMNVSYDQIEKGILSIHLSNEAKTDLEVFSGIMAEKLYNTICDCCKKIDPNHLNLGTRFPGEPLEWMLSSMKFVDVLSINCYKKKLPVEFEKLSQILNKPIIIGEWHFGAFDAGLPGIANQSLINQEERGKAFRVYQEWAASQWYCIGSHYFRYYDNPALGRHDGENYNIGFLNICNIPYEEMMLSARKTHECLYDVANGSKEPYNDKPNYLGL